MNSGQPADAEAGDDMPTSKRYSGLESCSPATQGQKKQRNTAMSWLTINRARAPITILLLMKKLPKETKKYG